MKLACTAEHNIAQHSTVHSTRHTHTCAPHPPTPANQRQTPIPTNTWHIFSFIPTNASAPPSRFIALSVVLLLPIVTYGRCNVYNMHRMHNSLNEQKTQPFSFQLRLLRHLSITELPNSAIPSVYRSILGCDECRYVHRSPTPHPISCVKIHFVYESLLCDIE